MSNYSENENSVRVDFFRLSGKWYTTEALLWKGYDGCIHDEFRKTLMQLNGRYEGMTAVCLCPYHKNAHPLMICNI